jgi:hypothetical protein
MGELRAHLPTGTPTTPRAVSSWGLVGLGLDTLRRHEGYAIEKEPKVRAYGRRPPHGAGLR